MNTSAMEYLSLGGKRAISCDVFSEFGPRWPDVWSRMAVVYTADRAFERFVEQKSFHF